MGSSGWPRGPRETGFPSATAELGSRPNFDFRTDLIGPLLWPIGVRDKYVDDAETFETVAGSQERAGNWWAPCP